MQTPFSQELRNHDRRKASWMVRLEAALLGADALRSAARFMLVGALGTLVDFSLFAVLSVQFGAPALLANALSYSAGILNNYTLHRYWTYRHRPRKAAGRQFSQFVGISLSALALNTLLVLILAPMFTSLLADSVLGVLAAKVIATGAGMGWNFLANHLWTFQIATS